MEKNKAIIFDAYGTLFDVNSAAEKCKSKIGDKWESFSNYWRKTQLEYTWLRSLMQRHKDFWEITKDSLDKSIKEFKIDPSLKGELLELYKKLSIFPEVNEVLKQLRKKNIKLAILSNGTPNTLNQLIINNKLQNIFDDIFSVEIVKIYKPSSKAYSIPIKKYKVDKKEILFLSSNTWDVSGAGNFGFNAIWVNRNDITFDLLDFKPNLQIKNLNELLDII